MLSDPQVTLNVFSPSIDVNLFLFLDSNHRESFVIRFIADSSNSIIRQQTDLSTGIIVTVVGNGYDDGFVTGPTLALTASLSLPTALLLSSVGDMYISNIGTNMINVVHNFTGTLTARDAASSTTELLVEEVSSDTLVPPVFGIAGNAAGNVNMCGSSYQI